MNYRADGIGDAGVYPDPVLVELSEVETDLSGKVIIRNISRRKSNKITEVIEDGDLYFLHDLPSEKKHKLTTL